MLAPGAGVPRLTANRRRKRRSMLSSVAPVRFQLLAPASTPATKAATLAAAAALDGGQAAAGPDQAPENVLLAYTSPAIHPPHGSSVACVPSARKITGVRPCTRHTDDRDVSRENKDGRPRRELIRRRYM
jgi:hypothetical protein